MTPEELVEEYVIERWLKSVPLEQRPSYEEIRRLKWIVLDLVALNQAKEDTHET